MDHRIDETTSSLVIYPIYGVRFDILSKWFEKFSMKKLQDQRDRASIAFSGDMLSMQYKFYFNLNGEKYATDFNELQAKVQKCAEYVFSEYSSLDKLYNKTILPILNGEVYLPDVGYTTAKNYDDEGNLTGETAEAEPTPYQKTANCKKYEAELGWYGLMSLSGKVITPPRYCDITAIGYDLYLCKTDDIRGEVLNGKGVRVR